tara:strand:+ start:23 stop:424 length:402 start_codon:yes stop_codon:yes gene_type:complete
MAILDFLSKPFEPREDPDESEFLDWYAEIAEKSDISLDPDDPEHYYDYRAAYESGAEPTYNKELRQWKWPSRFKHDLHKDRYIVDKKDLSIYDTKYDRPAKFEDLILQSFQRKEFEEDIFDSGAWKARPTTGK